jgi:hypothetical protein
LGEDIQQVFPTVAELTNAARQLGRLWIYCRGNAGLQAGAVVDTHAR